MQQYVASLKVVRFYVPFAVALVVALAAQSAATLVALGFMSLLLFGDLLLAHFRVTRGDAQALKAMEERLGKMETRLQKVELDASVRRRMA